MQHASDKPDRLAALVLVWDNGWCSGQFEKTTHILATLTGLHGQATTAEGKAALAAAVKRIEDEHKRQFPKGRARLAEMRRPS